ncbi:MAG: hypothetical protein J6M31_01520 [Bacteroidales bacterium]|nr:hypothetical protein [Bacteroidales bacterium]
MRSYIKLSENLRAQICKRFKVTRKTVWQACAGLSNSDLSRKIRQYALSNGGQWVKEIAFIPECRTRYSADGSWIQEFANGVEVLFTGSKAVIRLAGKEIDSYENVTLKTWGNVLCQAQAVAEGQFEAMVRQ